MFCITAGVMIGTDLLCTCRPITTVSWHKFRHYDEDTGLATSACMWGNFDFEIFSTWVGYRTKKRDPGNTFLLSVLALFDRLGDHGDGQFDIFSVFAARGEFMGDVHAHMRETHDFILQTRTRNCKHHRYKKKIFLLVRRADPIGSLNSLLATGPYVIY